MTGIRKRMPLVVLCFAAVVAALAGCGGSKSETTGILIIESVPEQGATVRIGGRTYGETPAKVTDIPAGQVFIILQKEGFKKASRITSVPEEGEHRVEIELQPIVGYLSLKSEPRSAEVYLDDEVFLGLTPFEEKPVPIGEHTYHLRKEDYESLRKEIKVEEDYRYTFSHVLTPEEGELQVISRPTGAKIWLNESPQEQTTPAKFTLPPGTYTVSVYADGFVMEESTVDVESNKVLPLDLKLKEGYVPPGMILVPAGEFILGTKGRSPDERPRKEVDLDAYYIDRFEVTNAQFKEVFPSHSFEPGLEQYPVTGVTWQQAENYAEAVGKRLPTEQEWEKAARGTDGREYPWGNTWESGMCNNVESEESRVSRIGSYRAGASPFGCMDMAGNVMEWTADWYKPYEGNKVVTREYGQVYRVLRGGSFKSERFDVRCARRHFDKPDVSRPDYGFRCAQDIIAPSDQDSPRPGAPAR